MGVQITPTPWYKVWVRNSSAEIFLSRYMTILSHDNWRMLCDKFYLLQTLSHASATLILTFKRLFLLV